MEKKIAKLKRKIKKHYTDDIISAKNVLKASQTRLASLVAENAFDARMARKETKRL